MANFTIQDVFNRMMSDSEFARLIHEFDALMIQVKLYDKNKNYEYDSCDEDVKLNQQYGDMTYAQILRKKYGEEVCGQNILDFPLPCLYESSEKKKSTITIQELDNDLDEYMKKRDCSSHDQ